MVGLTMMGIKFEQPWETGGTWVTIRLMRVHNLQLKTIDVE